MANEATLLIQTDIPIPYTCADGTGIEKGAVLKLSNPRTVALSSVVYEPIAGVLAAEKIASNGVTQVGVFKRGRFKMKLSGSCTAGHPVASASDANFPNYVCDGMGVAAVSGSAVMGIFEETGTTGDTVMVYLNCGGSK